MAKSTSPQQQAQTTDYSEFLANQKFLLDRVQADIDIYPSIHELAVFQKIAKEIDTNIDFQVAGFQECVRSLITFVYNNYNTNGTT